MQEVCLRGDPLLWDGVGASVERKVNVLLRGESDRGIYFTILPHFEKSAHCSQEGVGMREFT